MQLADLQDIIHNTHLVFIQFSTTWCYPCNSVYKRITEHVLPVIQQNSHIKYLRIDVDEDDDMMEWAKSQGMEVVPSIICFFEGKRIAFPEYSHRGQTFNDSTLIRGNVSNITTLILHMLKI